MSNFSLFPSPDSSLPRKPSTRRARAHETPNSTTELNLKGVAFQVVTSSRKTAKVQPATDTIKHALFCEPPSSENASTLQGPKATSTAASDSPSTPSATSGTVLRRVSRTRRKSGISTPSPPVAQHTDAQSMEDDSLSDLPLNTHFTATTPPRRSLSAHSRSRTPLATSIQPDHANMSITPVDEKKDHLSPLPEKSKFAAPTTGPNYEYLPTLRSGSPAPSKASQHSETYTSPMRSIFPVYDPSKPLDRQSYYPSASASPPPAYLGNNVSKMGSPVESQSSMRYDSVYGLLDGYEHVPVAAHGDMEALWKASREEYPVAGRKVQFGLYQPPSNGRALAIGTSPEDLIYRMEKDDSSSAHRVGSKQFDVRKHCPTARTSAPVATLVVPDRSNGKPTGKGSKETTDIFPHAAAMHAIEAILSTPESSHIATFDRATQSPETANLARDAVTEAHRRYGCELVKRTRKRDSLGSVTAHYELAHPILGRCPVTVTKSLSAKSISGPRAKISFHHPSATPAAVAAETLNLAFIDFAHDACVLDMPGLLALDCHFTVDTVISTLLAVAVLENDALVAETLVFEAPPKTPLRSKTKKEVRRSSMFKRTGTKKGKKEEKQEEYVPEQVELGGVAKGVLAVMELTFKATAWVIVSGVKVGFGVVGYGVDKVQKRM